MNDQYERLRQQFNDPNKTFDPEAVPPLRAMPRDFFDAGLTRSTRDEYIRTIQDHRNLAQQTLSTITQLHETSLKAHDRHTFNREKQLERRVVRVLFNRIADPDRTLHQSLGTPMCTPDGDGIELGVMLQPDKTHFAPAFRRFVRRLCRQHKRAKVLYYILYEIMGQLSAWALNTLRAEADLKRSELNALLYAPSSSTEDYRTLSGIFHLDDALVGAFKVFDDDRPQPFFRCSPSYSSRLTIRFYRLLFSRGADDPWTDRQRSWIIRHRAFRSKSMAPCVGKEFFRAIALLHDQRRFYARSDSPAIRAVDKTLAAIRALGKDNTEIGEEEYRRALNGRKSERLIGCALNQRHEPALRTTLSYNDPEPSLYEKAASRALNDARPLRMAERHIDPNQKLLNRALRENLKALSDERPTRFDRPLGAFRYLLERGAELEKAIPEVYETVGNYYAHLLLDASNSDPLSYCEILDTLAEQHGGLTDDSAILYELNPDLVESIGLSIFDPLIRRRILPSKQQLRTVQQNHPSLFEQLVERLPMRIGNAGRV